MITREIVRLLKYQANKWNEDGMPGILTILNQAQNLLYMVEHPKNMILDTTTGDFPYIETTANTREYTMPANVWRVTDLLLSKEIYPIYGESILTDYGRTVNISTPIDTVQYNGKEYSRYQQMRSYDYQSPTQLARVLFVALDPGDTTDRYFRLSYQLPTQLTTLNTALTIQSPLDFEYLFPAAQALIDGMEHGTFREMLKYVQTELAPQLWNKIGEGANATSYHVHRRKV